MVSTQTEEQKNMLQAEKEKIESFSAEQMASY